MTYNTTTAIESLKILNRIGEPANGSVSNDIKANKEVIDDVSTKIGTSSDGSTASTVFGKLANNMAVSTQLQSSIERKVNINYLTSYRVELVNIPSGATYTYEYMVKLLYGGIFETSGALCSDDSGTKITSTVIPDTILSNGLLYDTNYYNSYRIEKYDNSKKVIYLRNELTGKYFYIKLNSIDVSSGFDTTALEYNTKTNTITTVSTSITSVINAYIPFIATSSDTYKLDKLFVQTLPTNPYSTLDEKIPCCTLEKAA